MNFSKICDIVLLISALCLATTNIINFFAKPTSKFKKKKAEELKELIEVVLDEKLPDFLHQNNLETRQKYLGDRQRYLSDIKSEVLADTKELLDNIYKLNLEQSQCIKILSQGNIDMLRQRIMEIYHRYKNEKKMPVNAEEALNELYKDYKAQGGNSYIDKYYKRMSTWEVYEEDNYED